MSSLRLKEQDELISHIRRLYSDARKGGNARAVHYAFSTAQAQLDDHYAKRGSGEPSLLTPTCPSISSLFLRLDLLGALAELDATAHLTSRVHVPPTFAEVRSVLNLAVVAACAAGLRLLTLDADDTLYNDGGNLSFDAPNIPYLIRLMRMGVRVAVVTAAAYPGAPERYENRLAGLLSAMAFAVEAGAPPGPLVDNFMVMGGQCNCACASRVALHSALHPWARCSSRPPPPPPHSPLPPWVDCLIARCTTTPTVRVYLEELPGAQWKKFRGVRWAPENVKATLDVAESALRSTAAALGISSSIILIRKERAVGCIAKDAVSAPLSYEILEELTLATQAALEAFGSGLPTCCFNGGHDVFVDVGSKALGLAALQGLLGATPESTVHVGDRFTSTGNDLSTRDRASTLWTSGPANTLELLHRLVPLVAQARAQAAASAAGGSATATAAAAAGAEGGAVLRRAASLSDITPSPSPSPGTAVGTLPPPSSPGSGGSSGGLILQPPLSIRAGGLHHLPLSSSTSSLLTLGHPPPSPRSGGAAGGHTHTHGVGAEMSFGSDEGEAEKRALSDQRSLWLAAGGEIVTSGNEE